MHFKKNSLLFFPLKFKMRPEEVAVEFDDLYRHDEEVAYLTLVSDHIPSLNFVAHPEYTIKFCKEIVQYHHPEMTLDSFHLVAGNRIRSEEETLEDIFDGSYYPSDSTFAARKMCTFSNLMQLSIWRV